MFCVPCHLIKGIKDTLPSHPSVVPCNGILQLDPKGWRRLWLLTTFPFARVPLGRERKAEIDMEIEIFRGFIFSRQLLASTRIFKLIICRTVHRFHLNDSGIVAPCQRSCAKGDEETCWILIALAGFITKCRVTEQDIRREISMST